MAQRVRVLLLALSFVFCLVRVSAAHAQVAPERAAPIKLTLHPMTARQQVGLFAAGFGGATLGAALAFGTGVATAYALQCNSCSDDDGGDLTGFVAGAMVAGAGALVMVPLGAALAEQAAGRRMGYRTRIGKAIGGAFVGMGIAAGVDTGIALAFAHHDASGTGAEIATTVVAGLAIIALSSSLFHRIERRGVQAVPTLAPTAQGGFTAGVAGRF